ncbi:MAG TPA: EamA family transporter [Ktedonobacterales bacterium]
MAAMMRVREYAALFGLALIWGASFLFIKIAVSEVSPGTLVAGRLLCSLVTLGAIAALHRELLTGWRRFTRYSLLVGSVNITAPYLLIGWGEVSIASGTASILNATTPLFAVLLAHWWRGAGHEGLTWRRAGGVLVGFAGVATLVGTEAFQLGQSDPWALAGEGAVLLAAACYAVGALLSRRYNQAAPLVGPIGSQAGALLLVLPVAALWSPPTQVPSVSTIGAIVMLGVPGLAIAYLLYFWLIRQVGPTRTTLVTYLLPCTALVWGALLLGERISWNDLVGLALVLLGTMLTNGTLSALFRRRSSTPPVSVEAEAMPVGVAAPSVGEGVVGEGERV